jgi:hypothetical protein
MILSEYDRRWAEIRLYQFCIEVYQVRHQSIDIFDYTDLICDFGNISKTDIKTLIQVFLSDPYYKASRREIIIIGDIKGLSTVQLGNYLNMTRQGISKYLKTNKDLFTPLPRCSVEDDRKIITFLNTLDKLRSIGSLGDGTFN